MRITKLVHSCLYVEHDGRAVLMDPGKMAWDSGLIQPGSIHILDAITISHEHYDHFHLPLIQQLVAQFPKVQIFTTDAVRRQLIEAGINNAQTKPSDFVRVEYIRHESMQPLAPPPGDNMVAHVFGLLTHSGDSHHVLKSESVLAVPLAGPWGATIDGVRMVEHLGPHIVLPIHDWMWNPTWKADMYERMEAHFAKKGMQFIKLQDGVSVDLPISS